MYRRTSINGVKFLQEREELRLARYKCAADKWTIGYGHVIEPSGLPLTCTEEQADQWLDSDLLMFERTIIEFVLVPLNQNQFDALVSFCFNEGRNAFRTSTLLKYLNQEQYWNAANQFAVWNKIMDPKTKKLVVCDGLTNRRAKEKALFLTPMPA